MKYFMNLYLSSLKLKMSLNIASVSNSFQSQDKSITTISLLLDFIKTGLFIRNLTYTISPFLNMKPLNHLTSLILSTRNLKPTISLFLNILKMKLFMSQYLSTRTLNLLYHTKNLILITSLFLNTMLLNHLMLTLFLYKKNLKLITSPFLNMRLKNHLTILILSKINLKPTISPYKKQLNLSINLP